MYRVTVRWVSFHAARAACGAALCAAAALPSGARSAEYASMAVSLVVPQSCLIQSGSAAAVKPVVTCLHGEPYGVLQTPADPTEAPSALQLATPSGRAPIWTVGF
jgi:hypothetical protein